MSRDASFGETRTISFGFHFLICIRKIRSVILFENFLNFFPPDIVINNRGLEEVRHDYDEVYESSFGR